MLGWSWWVSRPSKRPQPLRYWPLDQREHEVFDEHLPQPKLQDSVCSAGEESMFLWILKRSRSGLRRLARGGLSLNSHLQTKILRKLRHRSIAQRRSSCAGFPLLREDSPWSRQLHDHLQFLSTFHQRYLPRRLDRRPQFLESAIAVSTSGK